MAAIKSRLEASSSSDDDQSSSIAPYTTFDSLTAEDSVEQIRKRNSNIDINGDPAHSRLTVDDIDQKLTRQSMTCYWKCIDITIVVVIVVLVWLMMSLPTVFYIQHTVKILKQEETTTLKENTTLKANNTNNNVTCTLYADADSKCKEHLQWYTKCLKGIADSAVPGPTNVYVSSMYQQDQAEEKIKFLSLAKYVNINLRQECLSSLEPLICLYFIHLCDDEMNTDIGPSEKQCRYVSEACDKELKLARENNIQIEEYLLGCAQNSPFDNKKCFSPNISTQNGISNNNTQNCSSGFFLSDDRLCLPECSVWTPYSQNMVLITDILTMIPAAVGVISGLAVLLLSWTRYQKMYRYPSIFVIYQTIPATVLAVLVLVGVSARRTLFCRSRNLIESVKNPMPFCILTGIVLYYVMMQLLLWWLWHTIAVFRAAVWPLHAINTSKKNGYRHLVFGLAGLILPVVPILIVVFGSRPTGGFTITRAPPILCAGFDLHINFWAFIFPMSLLLATGVTLLVFILRIVIKHHYISKIHKITVNFNWAVETKVLIVLSYYIILGAAVLTVFTIALVNLNIKIFLEYFACESKGLPPPDSNVTRCEKEMVAIRKTLDPIAISVAIIILGVLPVVNLIYVVKLSELKSKIKTYTQTRYVQYIQKEPDRSSSTRYVPYNEHRNTILHCESMTIHDTTVNTEPLVTSQMNKDLRK